MNVGCPSCETVYRVDPSKVPEGGVRARCTMCSEIIEVSSTGVEPKRAPEFTPARATSAPVRVAPEPRPSPPRLRPIVEPAGAEETPASVAAVPARGRRRATRPISAPPTPVPPPVSAPVLEPPVRVEPEEHVTAPLSIVPPAPPVEEPEAPAAPDRPSAPVFRPEPGPPMAAPPVPPAVEEPPPAPEAPVEVEPEPAVIELEPEPPETPPAAEPVAVEAPAPEKKAPINPFLARDPRQKARRLARALVSDMIVYQPDKRQQALAAGNLKEAFEEEIQKSWEEYVEQIGPELANSTPYFTDALNDILAGGQNLF